MDDDLFGEIDYRSKSDSIVMRLLRCAMDKAHEKVQSKDGPIEFLHERSKFYELASILVEGGLNIVQEETDVVEDKRDKILSDLMESRNWLQGRIKDMKHLIIDKDRELIERLENESKLRHALELKERELVHLHDDKLEPGRMKNEDSLISNETIEDRTTEGDICELKNSLDQQVLNIKQKLEDEHKCLTTNDMTSSPHVSSPVNLGFKEKEFFCWDDKLKNSSRPEQNTLIRWMSSDIDHLKETLDLAFGRMQSAQVVLPLEKQWRRTIEKDIESILFKGFTSHLQQSFQAELTKKISLYWSELSSCESLKREMRKLKKDRDDLSLQILSMEATNQVLFQGLVEDFNSKLCFYDAAYALENLIREDIYQFVIVEAVKDFHVPLKGSRALLHFPEDTPRSRKTDGDERFVEKLDCLSKCLEAEEDLVLRASSEIKEHSVKNDLVILDCEEMEERNAIEWLLKEDESTFSSVCKKLEDALQQLHTSKELVVELEQSLELSDDFQENDHDLQLSNILKVEQDKCKWPSLLQNGDNEFVEMIPSDTTVFSSVIQLQQVLLAFEIMVNKNLDMKCQRLEALRRQVHRLIEPVDSIRKRKLVYKKAFISRCHNLQLAESEVDLLGDQVDTLLLLLEKIYFELNQNATILSRYFGVFEVLKLIKRELSNKASGKPKP